MKKDLIPTGQMASIHGISRQTLILYDKKGLFHPEYVSESGYRYYSAYQIPYLREICFLRQLGMSLDRINEHMHHRNTDSVVRELTALDQELEQQILELQKKRVYIQQRMQLYDCLDIKRMSVHQPFIQWYPERKVIFAPFEGDELNKRSLTLALMRAWNALKEEQMIPAKGFGTLFRYRSVCEENPLYQAGSIVQIPFPEQMSPEKLYTLPAGDYVTMYKYGMPYDTEALLWLLDWVRGHDYEINGDIIDLCLLDTTFYDEHQTADFCRLEVPVRSRND